MATPKLTPTALDLLRWYADQPEGPTPLGTDNPLWRRVQTGTWDRLEQAGFLAGTKGVGWEVTAAGREYLAALATAIPNPLTARLLDRIDTPDGTLYVKVGRWSAETIERPEVVAALAAADMTTFREIAGPYEHVLLLSDPHAYVDTEVWCRCPASPPTDQWVRYETHTAEGRVAHGWACPGCGGILQTG